MASSGLLALAALGFRVRRRDQTSVSVSICRVAVLGGSPHQLTLSRSSLLVSQPSQSSNGGGGGLARSEIRRPHVCYPFLRLIAKVGSVTDTLTLTGEYAYSNDFDVRLRTLTDLVRV
jgi:hypothetical protein